MALNVELLRGSFALVGYEAYGAIAGPMQSGAKSA